MIIDYDKLESEVATTVRAVENKPHVRYIRYLLSKQLSPSVIRKELQKIGVSAPHEKQLTRYFLAVIDPIIKEFKIEKFYKDYKSKIMQKNIPRSFSNLLLNFDVSFEKEDEARIRFCKFVTELEIDGMWSNEVTRYYGGVQNIPQDESGERVIKSKTTRNVEKILISPKRYIIDKLILEDVPPSRIVKYLKEKHQVAFNEPDLYAYIKYFCNFRRKNIEETIERLLSEKNSLESDLEILDANTDFTLGDKLVIRKQCEDRIKFLESTIKELNAAYTDLTFKQGMVEDMDLTAIFKDITVRGYERFKDLDRHRDRDVVDPLTKVVKMMTTAVDKFQALTSSGTSGGAASDKHAGEVLFDLYNQRYDEVTKENEKKVLAQDAERLNDELERMEIEGVDEI